MARALRVLIVEDSDDDYALVLGRLRAAGFQPQGRRVQTDSEMKAALASADWDIVLSDFSMPGFDALAALRALQSSRQPGIPFVIVSGSVGEVIAVNALKAGASNYVMKGHLDKLAPVIERELKDAHTRAERDAAFLALEAAVKARDEFIAIASHELKTPLTSLDLQVERLVQAVRRGAAAADLSAHADAVAASSARLAALVEGLLDVTRLGAREIPLAREEIDLVALCREVVQKQQTLFTRTRSPLTVRLPERLIGRWDGLRLGIVVRNLLVNAAKFGEGKPVMLDVQDDGENVTIRVIDQGIGIQSTDLSRIFNKFERAVSVSHAGFGVGLWVARRIVEAHGGTIAAESEPGNGARFTVRIPKN